MKLYHGTTDRHLTSILARGIVPRGGSRRGNWSKFPSHPKMVYMTTAYAPYFAWVAADIRKREKAMIVEIDLERLKTSSLYPDEDFIAQALSRQQNVSIDSIHDTVRRDIEGYRHHAFDSLSGLGNICHKGAVPAEAITRIATIDLDLQSELSQVCMDPSVSTINYQILGGNYRSVISWIFGDRDDFEVGHGVPNEAYFSMVERSIPGYGDRIRSLFSNRDGINVVLTSPATTRKMKPVVSPVQS